MLLLKKALLLLTQPLLLVLLLLTLLLLLAPLLLMLPLKQSRKPLTLLLLKSRSNSCLSRIKKPPLGGFFMPVSAWPIEQRGRNRRRCRRTTISNRQPVF